jgi:hypothetical protein
MLHERIEISFFTLHYMYIPKPIDRAKNKSINTSASWLQLEKLNNFRKMRAFLYYTVRPEEPGADP